MSLCINPHCSHPNHPGNAQYRSCQSCNSELLLQGRYKVIRLLSDNTGFGTIYEATDGRETKILKILKIDDPKAIELFQQEAQVLSQLNHPGIPKIDTYFIWKPDNFPKPLHCLVMEKIQGQNLQKWMQNRPPINFEQALDWLKQLVKILDCVHVKNYFHRDIKPANIMRRPNGKLVLIDFGTAREVTHTYLAKMGSGSGVTSIASAGYTPIEQNNGKAVPESDFYALGRTFVYLLSGKNPTAFDENPRTGELLWRDSVPNLPQAFGDLIDKMMAPFPGNRPSNTQIILDRLAAIEGDRSAQPTANSQQSGVQVAATVPLFVQRLKPQTQLAPVETGEEIALDRPVEFEATEDEEPRTFATLFRHINLLPTQWFARGAMALVVVTGGAIGYLAIPQFFQGTFIPLEAGIPEFSPPLPEESQPLPLPVIDAPTPAPEPTSIAVALQSQDKGVTLEVVSVREEGDLLVLDVNLRNQGSQTVKFLYSFLELSDNSGQTLVPSVEGLPEDLPPDGRTFSGKLEIPRGMFVQSRSVSLKLAEPDGKINLEIPEIPIVMPNPINEPLEHTIVDPLQQPFE